MHPLVTLVLFGLSVLALILAVGLRDRVQRLEDGLAEIRTRLEIALRELKRLRGSSETAPSEEPASFPATAQQPVTAPFSSKVNGEAAQAAAPESSPATAQQPVTAPFSTKVEIPAAADAPPVAFLPIPLTAAPPDIHPSKQTQFESASPAASGTAAAESTAAKAPPAAPPAPPALARIDWESFIGVKLFSWIAAVCLALAAAYFFREAVRRGLIGPPLRMALGLIVGVGLLVVCELKAARRYAVTANALDAAGVAILFATFFASHSLWHLLDVTPTFLAMALVTAVAVALSIRHDSLFIALLGLIGGFATPALLSTGEDRPIGLFGYLLLLNAGLAWVAYRKRWPFLSVLSLVFTTFYQWAWVAKFLDETKLGLAGAIFLVFPVLSLVALGLGERREGAAPGFEKTAAIGAALPLLFAVFLASVPAYGKHTALLFGFLFLVDLGLAAVAMARDAEPLHPAAALATLVVFAVWLGTAGRSAAFLQTLVFTALFAVLYLAAPFVAQRLDRPFSRAAAPAVYAAPLLLFVFPVLAGLPAAAAPATLFGVLFVLAAGIAGAAVLYGKPELHVMGFFFVTLTEVTWASAHLSRETRLPGLGVFTAFALLFFAVPGLARRGARAGGFLAGRAAYFGLSGHALLLIFAAGSKAVSLPPGPAFGVLAVLGVAAFAAALAFEEAGIHTAALAITQLSLMVWVATARNAPWPGVGLSAAVAAGLFALAAFALAKKPSFAVSASVALLLGPFVAITASLAPGSPGAPPHAAAHAFFLVALIGISWVTEWHVLAVLGAVPPAIAAFAWRTERTGEVWREELLLAGVALFVLALNPLLLGKRAGTRREPYLAAVLSSIAFFFLARQSLTDGGFGNVIGLLPVAQAAVLAILLVRLRSLGFPAAEDASRLALVAGAALAFITVAIPLQLEKEWITIGWALLGAALAWLWRRIPHPGLLLFLSGLFLAVFVRLAFNPAVLTYHQRAATPVLNWFLYTYAIPAAAFFAAGILLRGGKGDAPRPLLGLLPAAGTVLLFLLLNIEIADFYSTGRFIAFNFFSATLAEGLAYTLGWALFALVLLVAGLALRNKPTRIAAIALVVATVLKGFLHDLGRLGGLYRVASLVGLAVSLALVALLLQRFVLTRKDEP